MYHPPAGAPGVLAEVSRNSTREEKVPVAVWLECHTSHQEFSETSTAV
jgi:hypothetical protein